MKTTVTTLLEKKKNGEKITMLTCYDYSTAKLMEEVGIDTILIGDSLGNTMLGYENTIPVTMEDMIHHCRAVRRATKDIMVVCDMPFLSYQTSVYDAVMNAGRLMKEGNAHMVKIEGGKEVAPQIEAIVKASIPVCGHLGLTPQSVNALGGYKVQGKNLADAQKLVDDAKAVEKAGASMLVLECVPKELATKITEVLSIPTIGIGAGNGCDGQVLVYQDMLGMFTDYVPKFVKQYGNIGQLMKDAFKAYKDEVDSKAFPSEDKSYTMDEKVYKKIKF